MNDLSQTVALLTISCQSCGARINQPTQFRRDMPCPGCGAYGYQLDAGAVVIAPHSTEEIAGHEVLEQVWFELAGHADPPSHLPIDTLNRLVGKHFTSRFADEPREIPTFCEYDIRARLEWWSTDEVTALWLGHERATPGRDRERSVYIHLPVLILPVGSNDCLIDGANRINRYFPDRLQIHGDHTQIAPSFNLLSRRSRPIA
jgi:hypothetical protein